MESDVAEVTPLTTATNYIVGSYTSIDPPGLAGEHLPCLGAGAVGIPASACIHVVQVKQLFALQRSTFIIRTVVLRYSIRASGLTSIRGVSPNVVRPLAASGRATLRVILVRTS